MPVMGNAYHESVPLSPVEKDTGNHEAPMLRIQTPVYQDRHAYEMPNDKAVESSQAILGNRNGNVDDFTPIQRLVSLDGHESDKKREPVLANAGAGNSTGKVNSSVQEFDSAQGNVLTREVSAHEDSVSADDPTTSSKKKAKHLMPSYDKLIADVINRHTANPRVTAIGDYAPLVTIPEFIEKSIYKNDKNLANHSVLYISDKRIVHSLHEKREGYDAVGIETFAKLPELLQELSNTNDENLGYYSQKSNRKNGIVIVVNNPEKYDIESDPNKSKRYCAFIFCKKKGIIQLITVRKYCKNDLSSFTKIEKS